MEGRSIEIVNDAYTLATFDNGSKCLLKLNKCLCDPDPLASESLLQPHHARHRGVLVDGCDKRHLSQNGSHGGQCMKVNEDKLPLMVDVLKVFFVITKPNPSDLNGKFPIHELTSPLVYNPQRIFHTRRLQQKY